METLTAKQIRVWGTEVGRREPCPYPSDDQQVSSLAERHSDNFDLQLIQIQATLEVAAQLADLRETLEPNRLTGLGRAGQQDGAERRGGK